MYWRVIYTIILLLLVFVAPWWLPTLLGLLGVVIWRNYFELPAVGLIYDLLYGLPGAGPLHSQFTMSVIAVVLVLLLEAFKERIIWLQQ